MLVLFVAAATAAATAAASAAAAAAAVVQSLIANATAQVDNGDFFCSCLTHFAEENRPECDPPPYTAP